MSGTRIGCVDSEPLTNITTLQRGGEKGGGHETGGRADETQERKTHKRKRPTFR
jgi:hypothetical protein